MCHLHQINAENAHKIVTIGTLGRVSTSYNVSHLFKMCSIRNRFKWIHLIAQEQRMDVYEITSIRTLISEKIHS